MFQLDLFPRDRYAGSRARDLVSESTFCIMKKVNDQFHCVCSAALGIAGLWAPQLCILLARNICCSFQALAGLEEARTGYLGSADD